MRIPANVIIGESLRGFEPQFGPQNILQSTTYFCAHFKAAKNYHLMKEWKLAAPKHQEVKMLKWP